MRRLTVNNINRSIYLLLIVLLAGCVSKPPRRSFEEKKTVRSPKIVMAEKQIANGDLLWPYRNQQASLMKALQFWEGGNQVLNNPRITLKLARGYFFAAFYFDQPELFKKGRYHSYQLLKRDKIILDQIEKKAQMVHYISRVQPRHYHRLYWYTINQLGETLRQKPYRMMLTRDDLIAQLNHLLRINPKKRTILSLYGALLIKLPQIAGGSISKGEQLIKVAIAAEPDQLLHRYLGVIYGARGDIKGQLRALIKENWKRTPENQALIKKIKRNYKIYD